MAGEGELDNDLQELAEKTRELVEGEESGERPERGRDVDMQFLQEVMYGLEAVSIGTHQLLYFSAMRYVRENFDVDVEGFEEAVQELAEIFDAFNLGTLEMADADEREIELSENALTSGSPRTDRTMCYFVSGYIAGFLETALGEKYVVSELKCSAEGAESCVFLARER